MDLYELLSVSPEADRATLRCAWAQQLVRLGPDRLARDFVPLWAYQTLADPLTRHSYDALRSKEDGILLDALVEGLHRKDLGAFQRLQEVSRQAGEDRAFLDNALGLIYLSTDQALRAEPLLAELASAHPRNPYLWVNHARALAAMGRHDEAERELRDAARLDVSEGEVFRALAELYLATDQRAKAEQVLRALAADQVHGPFAADRLALLAPGATPAALQARHRSGEPLTGRQRLARIAKFPPEVLALVDALLASASEASSDAPDVARLREDSDRQIDTLLGSRPKSLCKALRFLHDKTPALWALDPAGFEALAARAEERIAHARRPWWNRLR